MMLATRLLFFALALWASQAEAHDPRSASVDVQISGSLATVHLAATQAGLHAALEAAAGQPVDASAPGYPALVAAHLRRTLRLWADGQPLTIGEVGVRLGSHQSDARFAVELPPGADSLTLTVDSFDGVRSHQTLTRVHRAGGTTRALLSDIMGRSLTFAVLEPAASVVEPVALATAEAQSSPLAGLLAPIVLVALALLLLMRLWKVAPPHLSL